MKVILSSFFFYFKLINMKTVYRKHCTDFKLIYIPIYVKKYTCLNSIHSVAQVAARLLEELNLSKRICICWINRSGDAMVA